MVKDAGFRAQGSEFRVQGSGRIHVELGLELLLDAEQRLLLLLRFILRLPGIRHTSDNPELIRHFRRRVLVSRV